MPDAGDRMLVRMRSAYVRVGAQRGFSLPELLVALGIVALLAALAIPSYTSYIRTAKLKDSAVLLTHTAAQIEKNFLDQRSYAKCENNLSGDNCACNVQPATDRDFDLECKISGAGYLLTASNRVGIGLGAAGDYQFTLNHLGARATLKFEGIEYKDTPCWLVVEAQQC